MNFKDYRFDKSSYERPNCKYRCGRSRLWQHSCWQGPGVAGECGGTTGCKPARLGDHYQCTRPPIAGGPCKQGPYPDGRCCQQHPPCVPKRSLRAWRGRISLLVLLFIIALIAAYSGFSTFSDSAGRPFAAMSDAGQLSASHAAFGSNEFCGSCHQAHKKTGVAWLASAFSDQDLTDGCLECHRFQGEARNAHQGQYPDRDPVVSKLECTNCHSEHMGKNADITQLAEATCSNCHRENINDFVNSHPAFANNYPYKTPHSIYFDHKRHIGEYFVEKEWTSKPNRDAEFAAQAAKACTTCHEVAGATRAVLPKTFEAMCSGCHQQQINSRPLIAMTGDEAAPVLTALAAASENELADDAESLAIEIIKQMKDDSMEPLMAMTGDASARLWAGLSAIEIKAAAEAWAQEEDMESPMPELQQAAGWHTGENDDGDQSLFYRAGRHADPVIKAWIENFVSQNKAIGDEDLQESMGEALDSLLDAKQGAGACGKCHASGIRHALTKGSGSEVLWGYQTQDVNLHTPYIHGPHINLTGDKEGCDSCHQFAQGVDFTLYYKNQGTKPDEFVSAFTPIEKQVCSECHNPEQTSDNCLTCHQYHGKSDFRIGFMPKHVTPESAESTTKVNQHD